MNTIVIILLGSIVFIGIAVLLGYALGQGNKYYDNPVTVNQLDIAQSDVDILTKRAAHLGKLNDQYLKNSTFMQRDIKILEAEQTELVRMIAALRVNKMITDDDNAIQDPFREKLLNKGDSE